MLLVIRVCYAHCTLIHEKNTPSFINKFNGNKGELYHGYRIKAETKKMTEKVTPSSTLQKNAQVLHVLYGLLDNDREPTDQDAATLRYLYSSS